MGAPAGMPRLGQLEISNYKFLKNPPQKKNLPYENNIGNMILHFFGVLKQMVVNCKKFSAKLLTAALRDFDLAGPSSSWL